MYPRPCSECDCDLLPHLPSQAELIPIKFKRKLHFKGHYLYDYVYPQNITRALNWLKNNNPLYANVPINLNWEVEAKNDNVDLFTGLTGKFGISDESINVKKNFVIDVHYNVLVDLANENGYQTFDLPGKPGDCLFNSVAYQLPSNYNCIDGPTLRAKTVEYLKCNPYVNGVHRLSFVADDCLNIPNGTALSDENKWQLYLHQLEGDLWAENVAIQAVADVLNTRISILSMII